MGPMFNVSDYTTSGIAEQVQQIDLTMILKKIMEPAPEGKGWTIAKARIVEMWYRRYLSLVLKYGKQVKIVPNYLIDAMWHQHILDTAKYQQDCREVFGYFLHHYPYFGLNGDAKERDEAFEMTNHLYRVEFGEDCTSMCKEDDTLNPLHKGVLAEVAVGCNSGGSGTGCSQL